MKKTILFLGFFLNMIIPAEAQFTRGFDSGNIDSSGWSVLNSGDANTWVADFPLFGTAHNGFKVARIAASTDALAHDDYLITPQMNVTAGLNDRLSFWVRSYNANFIGRMELKISTTTATSAANFSTTVLPSTQIPSTWVKININLNAYVGQSIYIGFHAMTNRYEFYIDEIINDAQPACNVTAPIISSTSFDCNSGNSSVTLTGLPATGTWTLNRVGSSSSFITGTGVSTTMSVPQNGNYHFYVVDSNGCQSPNSENIYIQKLYDIDIDAPMTGSYADANTNGIVDAGDIINYLIEVNNTGFCSMSNTSINGVVDPYNVNLNFSGNPIYNIPTISGSTSVTVPATYTITQNDINNGEVQNSTSVNGHWPGSSTMYFPSCTTSLTNMNTGNFVFETLKYSPNPVKNYLSISNATPIDAIQINSLLGQKVLSKKGNTLQNELDLSGLDKGVYFVKVLSKGFEKTFKIIKE